MLIDQLQGDLHQAQLEKNDLKVSTLRLLLSEINYAKIAKQGELSEADVLVVIQKEVKKRKEAATGFRQGGREELAKKEEDEEKILVGYLPPQLSDEDLGKIVEEVIREVDARSISDMGKVIGAVMTKAKGQVEGARVSSLVKEKLLTESQ